MKRGLCLHCVNAVRFSMEVIIVKMTVEQAVKEIQDQHPSFIDLSLADAFKIIANPEIDFCPVCGMPEYDEVFNEILEKIGIDLNQLRSNPELEEEISEAATNLAFTDFPDEGGYCNHCGYSEFEFKRDAHDIIDDVYENALNEIVGFIEDKGGDPWFGHSGLSEAKYLEFNDRKGKTRKVRIAAHEARPTYQKTYGSADFEAVIDETVSHQDADGNIEDLKKWIDKVGVESS